ncbi:MULTISPECIES: pyocin S6 family toxin immunity protein [unclassified Pseudomonas]|uniref:pyocin S6 family toxin immunity protein n=1 Tax=unclassified Pseudomonas TaxID=196821 RepID=UPI002A361ACD|nr:MULTISPECIES: pyocin S6 family toxin immunity protein [unclassified Pseudomonas]WPN64504.1 pyocin S6 family toxin immunity protein [Pseudomonas sp. P9_32]WPN70255.1 pyocin S6 family toxin immunity protein [Pseudomonas sp. P9_35]
MPCFSITGFYPDDKKDDSLQFEIYIEDAEKNEALAQITEAKPFNEVEPGELEITEEQLREIEKILDIKFPDGLEYYIGTCAD